MTVYFMGSVRADFHGGVLPNNGNSTASLINSARMRGNTSIRNDGTEYAVVDLPSVSTFSFRFTIYPRLGATAGAGIELRSGGSPFLRLVQDAGTVSTWKRLKVQVFDGSWTTVMDPDTGGNTLQHQVVSNFIMDVTVHPSAGSVVLYEESSSLSVASEVIGRVDGIDTGGSLSAVSCDELRFRPFSQDSNYTYFSEVAVSSRSLANSRLLCIYPNGAGATSDFTGAYTAVDEPIWDNADKISSTSAGNVSTFAQTNSFSYATLQCEALGVVGVASTDAVNPTQLKWVARTGGTDYAGATQALAASPAGVPMEIWEDNPATAAFWTNTEITNMEIGVQSVA